MDTDYKAIQKMISGLPNAPKYTPSGHLEKPAIWHSGNEILCETEEQSNSIADLLEACGYEHVNTGYYDPKEDRRNGQEDELTGWYYVTI